ncbi:hypothetical protein RXV94_13880 [Yeosuana sp. MJ-SS3]|uniref:DUF4179 domain-containing protein n=1 Tax=Gilvirhabdus luticola TaxID=3079858 RepID=A0ABU3UA22_9FLAO|nr:hypothetical protein [Yeosuana sp. MJ-SS3]MDU8887257.1 hypothetical protein [Yeosuana sp. MJ-SS3]
MSKDNLDNLFEQFKNDFDLEEPRTDHKGRFLDKLNTYQKGSEKKHKSAFWKPLLGIAATIVLLVVFSIGNQKNDDTRDLASVSPEMAETEDFFTTTIEVELKKITSESSPVTQLLVDDALKQMKILENDYEKLKKDLSISDDDNRVIYAMISNFQNRIDLLKNTLEQIDTVKQLKNITNENKATI